MYPYKDKYSTSVGIEDFNIYENQIIKYSLIQIKERIEFYKREFDKNINYNYKYLDNIKLSIEKISKQNIENKRKDIIESINKKQYEIDKIIDNYIYEEKLRYSDNCVNILFRLHSILNILDEDNHLNTELEYNQQRRQFRFKFKSTYYKEINKYDLEPDYKKYFYRNIKNSRISKEHSSSYFETRRINLEFYTNDIRKIKFLYDKLHSGKLIQIELIAKIQNHNKNEDLFLIKDNKHKKTFIECEDLIAIDNEDFPNYTKEELLEFIKLNNIENEQEHLSFIESLDNKFLNLQNQRDNICNSNLFDESIKKIDELLNLEFIKNTKEKKDTLKPTQVFINDFSYNRVFRELKELNKKVQFLDSISPEMYFLKSTANIYEYWCLYKIVNVLVNDLRWTIKNKDYVIKDMDKLLKHKGKFDKPCIKIQLEHELKGYKKLTLDLIYEGKIYYEENKYKTPDYQFIFNLGKEDEKRIYLDAKYRNYKEQGDFIFSKDINEVAINKYHTLFKNTMNNSEVSFIVHSYKDKEYECFGGNHIIENNKLCEINYKQENIYNSAKHKFGSFYLLPSDSFAINKFLKMILEYHLDLYEICWNCGEIHNINKENKKTTGGNDKFYYTCKNCNEFWVKNHCWTEEKHKLIKHLDNYHYVRNDKNNPWYVTCPVCFDGLDENITDSYCIYDDDDYIFF